MTCLRRPITVLILQACSIEAMMNPNGLMIQMERERVARGPPESWRLVDAMTSHVKLSEAQDEMKAAKDVAIRKVWWQKISRQGSRRTSPSNYSRSPSEEFEAFLNSAVAEEWIMFAIGWVLLVRLSLYIESLECTKWWQHMCCLALWIVAALVFLAFTWFNWGRQSGEMWANGYTMELLLSMENVFLYELILVSFKVPAKLARYALFVTSLCQMIFQMFLFMGMAAYLQSMDALPYLLGAWLIFVAFQTMKDDEHEAFDAASSESYKAFRLAMGDRLLPDYGSEGSVFVEKDGRLRVTMLGPVIFCLLLVMFVMEVDVTLTKIEEIPNHFLAWSSSVLAAFALPELFVVVQELLRRFYLLKTGISFLLLFFGGMLIFRKTVKISDTMELAVMVMIILGSIVLSPILGYGERNSEMYVSKFDSAVNQSSLNLPPGRILLERATEDSKQEKS
mmetsp:Transcript_34711/g.63053  ORF Transcript_34711/g.63053 Transcript_34711/m.63053 type:complete len:451 (+) Transcript_34711:227-1579(+)|eukprot:CAMPEP_0197658688 /NCGR_PEP_ID=MMETSP1338-20131121/45380_1 /TAXON_ID=43686 ORGANISM="Pelagodinium beii, Strain RCC1491" /NCGR_SAMPLE_ID=MMETSP1338 /ASSEMBLY_ACC=CAM_ASM_000754 /LENGTH=450 /DNA_ID=CAMNT_0043235315 /DNA_START=220 /DNA_END=1572 /DNA_ORIENTATION=+